MVPRKRGGEEALALARTAFGLSAELTRATPLPSYDDQNWLLHSADVPRYVLKIAAAYAECRGCADEAATYEQLQLENAAMRALFAGGVSVPRPLRAKTSEDVIRLPTPPPCAIGQRSRVAAAAPAAAQEPADADAEGGPADFGEGIALVAFEAHRLAEAARPPVAAASEVSARASDAVTGRPVVEFARLLTFELGEHLAVAEHTPELLHRLGVLIAQSAHALAARLGSQDVAVASARRLTWDLANASAARRYLPKVADASDRALAETYLSRFDGCARARARLPAQVLHGDLNDYNILVNSNILRRAQGAKGMGAGGAAGAAAAGRAAVCADDNGAGCVAEAAPAPRRAVGVGAGAGAALPISSAGLTVLDFGDIVRPRARPLPAYALGLFLARVCPRVRSCVPCERSQLRVVVCSCPALRVAHALFSRSCLRPLPPPAPVLPLSLSFSVRTAATDLLGARLRPGHRHRLRLPEQAGWPKRPAGSLRGRARLQRLRRLAAGCAPQPAAHAR